MKGFTILEILLILIVMVLIISGVFLIVLNLSNFNTYFVFSLGAYRDVQITLAEIKKELKSAENSVMGAYLLEEASGTKITFYSDIDQDGLAEKITYYTDNDVLKKIVIKPSGNPPSYNLQQIQTKDVVKNLVIPQEIFTFYDKNNSTTTSIAKIKLVKVGLKVYIDYYKNTFENYIIIALRNVKDKN